MFVTGAGGQATVMTLEPLKFDMVTHICLKTLGKSSFVDFFSFLPPLTEKMGESGFW